MAITPWLPNINQISDGTDVSAATVNPILAQHTQREQHLYDKLAAIVDKSVLTAYEIPLLPEDPIVVQKYSVVFYTREYIDTAFQEGIKLAEVAFETNPNQTSFTAANSSYSIGIVKEKRTADSDVYLMGLIEFDVDVDDPVNGLIETSECEPLEDFEPGPYFLSRTQAGKITRNPGGVAIYIGYALNRRQFILAPNISEFNQFYTTYRYNVLDRPIGKPSLTPPWDVLNPDITRVGWMHVNEVTTLLPALAAYIPVGAKFFYNLPSDAEIAADTGISEEDRLEQRDFVKNLPPNPPNLVWMVVNGVIQYPRDDYNPDGVYLINEAGIWWFDDVDNEQPWASDIETSVTFTVNTGTDAIVLNNHGLEVDDVIGLSNSGGALPAATPSLAVDDYTPATKYYVKSVIDANNFTISTTPGGTTINITGAGTGTHSIAQPYLWKSFKGTTGARVRTSIHFLRINPSVREAVVTSIKKYNTGSNAIRFYKPDKTAESTTGDMLARLMLEFPLGTEATSSAKAIKSLTYNEVDGKITVVETPIVSKLSAGAGITIAPAYIDSVEQPGSFIVSTSANNSFGRVTSIEPDGAELLFTGLHSYINMPTFSVLPSSIIGKVTLPSTVPDADMTFVMLMIGSASASGAASVEFELTYAVSKNGVLLNSTVSTPVQVLFNIPDPYTAKTCFLVGNTTGAIATPTFKIPLSAFSGGDAAVNFKLARKTPGATPYNSSIGIIDIYWKIG